MSTYQTPEFLAKCAANQFIIVTVPNEEAEDFVRKSQYKTSHDRDYGIVRDSEKSPDEII